MARDGFETCGEVSAETEAEDQRILRRRGSSAFDGSYYYLNCILGSKTVGRRPEGGRAPAGPKAAV